MVMWIVVELFDFIMVLVVYVWFAVNAAVCFYHDINCYDCCGVSLSDVQIAVKCDLFFILMLFADVCC